MVVGLIVSYLELFLFCFRSLKAKWCKLNCWIKWIELTCFGKDWGLVILLYLLSIISSLFFLSFFVWLHQLGSENPRPFLLSFFISTYFIIFLFKHIGCENWCDCQHTKKFMMVITSDHPLSSWISTPKRWCKRYHLYYLATLRTNCCCYNRTKYRANLSFYLQPHRKESLDTIFIIQSLWDGRQPLWLM